GLTKDKPVIALTSGEPAGIGPELCVRLCAERLDARVVAIGERELLRGCPHVEHVALQRSRVPGKLDPANSRYVLAVLERASRGRAFSSPGSTRTAESRGISDARTSRSSRPLLPPLRTRASRRAARFPRTRCSCRSG